MRGGVAINYRPPKRKLFTLLSSTIKIQEVTRTTHKSHSEVSTLIKQLVLLFIRRGEWITNSGVNHVSGIRDRYVFPGLTKHWHFQSLLACREPDRIVIMSLRLEFLRNCRWFPTIAIQSWNVHIRSRKCNDSPLIKRTFTRLPEKYLAPVCLNWSQ